MALEGLVASVVCVVPAMAALLWFLDRYDGYFDHRRTFFALMVGLFAGIVVRFLEIALFPFDSPASVLVYGVPFSFAYTTVGFALVESFAKLVVLGSKKFRARQDTPFYGPALGLALGAIVSLQVVLGSLNATGALRNGLNGVAVLDVVVILVFATGLTLTHGASAIRIARHVAAGKLWHGLIAGCLWQMPATALFWVWSLNELRTGWVLVAFATVLWGALAAWLAQRNVLEKVVPPEIRDQVRRAKRRELRKARNE